MSSFATLASNNRKSILVVAATPKKEPTTRQEARIINLEAKVQELIEANEQSKEHLCKLNDRKESESQAILTKVHEAKFSLM
ncbi:hypothetical protein, partial [Enterobacter cloacae complex sp. 4DZ1-17B1]|uniref:hypothetical protein n=1 Tax=Enterobacter cloacae complex sp. 4DZ1-17B1 TaxID=2511991 RepID=UPI001CA58FFB